MKRVTGPDAFRPLKEGEVCEKLSFFYGDDLEGPPDEVAQTLLEIEERYRDEGYYDLCVVYNYAPEPPFSLYGIRAETEAEREKRLAKEAGQKEKKQAAKQKKEQIKINREKKALRRLAKKYPELAKEVLDD